MPDAIETLPTGATQSRMDADYANLFARALEVAARVRAHGVARYGTENHLGIPVDSHLNHAMQHIYNYKMGVPAEHALTTTEPHEHLGHGICRLLMALDCILHEIETREDVK